MFANQSVSPFAFNIKLEEEKETREQNGYFKFFISIFIYFTSMALIFIHFFVNQIFLSFSINSSETELMYIKRSKLNLNLTNKAF